MNLNKIRNEILSESKSYVVKYGWNENLFNKVAKNSKFESAFILTLFPEGYISLVQLYLDEINTKMTQESKKLNLIRLKVHERIRELCILRLKIMVIEKKLISKTFFHLLIGTIAVPLSAQEMCFCASQDGCQGGDLNTPWQ